MGNPGDLGANILLAEGGDHYPIGPAIRIAIGEMENTQSGIYRESAFFSAPLGSGIQVQVLLHPCSLLLRDIIKLFRLRTLSRGRRRRGSGSEHPSSSRVTRPNPRSPLTLEEGTPSCRPSCRRPSRRADPSGKSPCLGAKDFLGNMEETSRGWRKQADTIWFLLWMNKKLLWRYILSLRDWNVPQINPFISDNMTQYV